MTEPVSSTGAAISAGMTSGVLITLLHSQVDPKLVVGVVCGTCVFMMRSHEPSWFRKFVYSIVTLLGGFSLSSWAMEHWPGLPSWLAGFACAASIVTITDLVLIDSVKQHGRSATTILAGQRGNCRCL
ncbi:protein-S-isoprenylcysteine O-methyltransferase Ste14 [Paraburkholderia sp. HC6.4b]|uniref:putative holin n=1 Tax=unclassified Paraburkholderia TaxID=2615204 RepID=UPI0016158301|nr:MULTISPECIES: putative holin [unclassified Paraburkholderia]MBB5413673.1 protein-S-isoprenylcysteine O-methyltransferase Ste14 [Paraburkholderia sp. HC6.4b]MBB5456096.1 protein-S-isoprenylcysteine O-methyltransferase Ste14 [Paraburkholderia sp. Kb1A]